MTVPSRPASPAAKALAYAEDTLKVHEVYDDLVKAQTDLAEAHTHLREAASRKRLINENILDKEAELTIDQRGLLPEMAQTAFDKHIKTVFRTDPVMVALRGKLAEAITLHEGFEHTVKELEFEIRVNTARLEELGGYLQYLAAIKLTAVTRPEAPAGTTPQEVNQS